MNDPQSSKKPNYQLETIGLMASGIAHDFNNILAGIVGQTSLALANLPPENEARKHIERVVKAAEFGTSLTDQLLRFANDQNLAVEQVHIDDFILNNRPLFQMFLEHNIQLIFELEHDFPSIVIIRSQIQQVLMNLIVNSVRAIGTKTGHILIRTSTVECGDYQIKLNNGRFLIPGKYLRIEIEDTGVGIPPQTLSKIFTPFYTTRPKGNGLGLTNTMKILEQHNGGILIKSKQNYGTNASIFIPHCLKFPAFQ
ncbi:MAG: ATP-binding protein [Chloroflexota bacterium]